MSDAFLGEIRMFSAPYAPRGWALCNGTEVPLLQNQALFTLLSSRFATSPSKEKPTNVRLPDLRGRMPVGSEPGHGAGPFALGSNGGVEAFTLTIENLPAHNHRFCASPLPGTSLVQNKDNTPNGAAKAGAWLAGGTGGAGGTKKFQPYGTSSQDAVLSNATLSNSGTLPPLPVAVRSPWAAVGFIICLDGHFPSR